EDAFAASAGQPLPRVYEAADALVVAVVKSRERPDPSQYASQRAAVAQRLEGKREAAVLQAWTAELARKARVSRNQAYVNVNAVAEADR
ncbi:MAG: hypothetical protein WCC48_02295, partial [Anaeromyxobacteraceae bacterium]